jgi:hypothetical protein
MIWNFGSRNREYSFDIKKSAIANKIEKQEGGT